MRTEGDFIKINEWLLPFSWLYGLGVRFRNQLFELGILKSKSYKTPIISVGNITVGGSGKTPHVEYIVRLLKNELKVAVLSRGYKRKSKGYVLANNSTTMLEIGDEPYQMKRKFNDIYVAVDKNRCAGIEHLTTDEETKDTEVILLDDAFQHRYVTPGINILLIDYHRLIIYDKLLPAGRLREPQSGKSRADIVIITKCPKDLKPMEYRVLTKAMDLYPYQGLFFTSIDYGHLKALFFNDEKPLDTLSNQTNVLLVTGIASPKQLTTDLKQYGCNITSMAFDDHHLFTNKDIQRINDMFEAMPSPKIIITTEKDASRLECIEGMTENVKKHLYMLPITVSFRQEQQELFNEKILSYVRKNSRNSILAQRKNDNKSQNSHHIWNRSRTISFRNN